MIVWIIEILESSKPDQRIDPARPRNKGLFLRLKYISPEMLINPLCGKIINDVQGLPLGRHAHGAQEPRHI